MLPAESAIPHRGLLTSTRAQPAVYAHPRFAIDLLSFSLRTQVVKVFALTIPLASLIGLAEELAFRGILPLVLTDLTGLPTAAVIGLSALIFGVRQRNEAICFFVLAGEDWKFHGFFPPIF